MTVQAQILTLLRELQKEFNTAILLITHDMGVVAEMCDRVLVMYGGQKMEQADTDTLFAQPAHPYTQGLLRAIPSITEDMPRLPTILGNPPSALINHQAARLEIAVITDSLAAKPKRRNLCRSMVVNPSPAMSKPKAAFHSSTSRLKETL